jgi:hypothetical protein
MVFGLCRAYTEDLKRPGVLQGLKARGFAYIGPVVRPWASTLRDPIHGRLVELVHRPWYSGHVALDSREGRKMLHTVAVRS